MSRVCAHFGIPASQSTVDFVDIELLDDNQLYIDPSMIRRAALAHDPYGVAAYARLVDFFDFVLASVHGVQAATLGHDALLEFHEPRETRLGMSRAGVAGSGASSIIGDRIWRAVAQNPLCLQAVLVFKRVEHIPIFVRDVSNDRLSDLTTRIVFQDLVRFTADQMIKHPQLATSSVDHRFQQWDTNVHVWNEGSASLPNAPTSRNGDIPLVLVPRWFVHRSIRMSPSGFWSREAVGAIQDDETSVSGDGRILRPSKKSIKGRESMRDIRPVNSREALRVWKRDEVDLVAKYQAYVDAFADTLDPEEIERRLQHR